MKQKRKISVLIALMMVLTVAAIPSMTYGASDNITYGIGPKDTAEMPDYLAVGGTLDLEIKSNPASNVDQNEWKWKIDEDTTEDQFDSTKKASDIAVIDPNTGVLTAKSEGKVRIKASKGTVSEEEAIPEEDYEFATLKIGYLIDTDDYDYGDIATNGVWYTIRLYPNKTAKLGDVNFDDGYGDGYASGVSSTMLAIPSQYVIDNPAWSDYTSEFDEKYYGTYSITSIAPDAVDSKKLKDIIVPDTVKTIGNCALGYDLTTLWNDKGEAEIKHEKVNGITIYGTPNNSEAARYAKANGFAYKNMDAKMDVKPVTVKSTSKPKKVAGVKAKAGKKQMTVSWKSDKSAKGYQITYSQNKKFKKGTKNVAITKNNTTKKTIKKLKAKKTYYVKVRAYKQAGNKKVYGAYSKMKTVKIK